MKPVTNVLIYGGGAVGSILGWRLAERATNQVSVVCRSNFEPVRNSGYRLQTALWGSGRFIPEQVMRTGNLRNRLHSKSRFDYVVCANKLTNKRSIETMTRDLQHVIHPRTALVSAQNGMDVELPLRQAFPRNTILSAICQIGCYQGLPGFVQQHASMSNQAFLVGLHSGSRDGRVADEAKRDKLASMDERFTTIEDVEKERWRKLIFNCAWNSTTALTGLDTQQLAQMPGGVEMMHNLAQEALNVATASGVEVDPSIPSTIIEIARESAPIVPSSLQDARSRRPMELNPIFGYLVTQAAKVGVPVPTIGLVYDRLRQMNDAFAQETSLGNRDIAMPASSQPFGLDASISACGVAYQTSSKLANNCYR